jgi:ABC-2 type transport system permease protein
MRDLLDVYAAHFRTSLAMWLHYRVKLAIWIASLVIEPIIYITVWTLISDASERVQGYGAGDFAAYYIVWTLVRHVVIAFGAQDIARRIRNGLLSDLLILPLHPIHADAAYTTAYKLVSLPFILMVVTGMALVFRPTLELEWWNVAAFLPALLIAAVARFILHWTLGLIAFWITQARSVFSTI